MIDYILYCQMYRSLINKWNTLYRNNFIIFQTFSFLRMLCNTVDLNKLKSTMYYSYQIVIVMIRCKLHILILNMQYKLIVKLQLLIFLPVSNFYLSILTNVGQYEYDIRLRSCSRLHTYEAKACCAVIDKLYWCLSFFSVYIARTRYTHSIEMIVVYFLMGQKLTNYRCGLIVQY